MMNTDPDPDPNPTIGGQLPNSNECNSTLTSGTRWGLHIIYISYKLGRGSTT